MFFMGRSIWNYRDFILGSVKREFQSKYQNSILGGAWAVLHPMAMILVYTVIFSQVMKTRLPHADSSYAYSIYLCAGMLTWGLFAEIVGRGQNLFIDNANLLKKISFPRVTLPVILILNACINFAIIFGLFLAFLFLTGHWPGWTLLNLLPLLGIQLLLATGLAMVLGVVNVFFRDVGQFFAIFLQFWFWVTPIVYPAVVLPAQIAHMQAYNPMYPLVNAYQSVLMGQPVADWLALKVPLILGILLCLLGWRMFRRHVGEMVDEL